MGDSSLIKRLTYNVNDWNSWRKARSEVLGLSSETSYRVVGNESDRLEDVVYDDDSYPEEKVQESGKMLDLSGANLKACDLIGANLSNTDLSGADLTNALLMSANLARADLTSTVLENSNLFGANLNGASLSGANLRGALLRGASIRFAKLNGANLNSANLFEADLRGSDFVGSNLTSTYLKDSHLEGAWLKEANLSYSILDGANFQAVVLGGTVFGSVDLSGVHGLETCVHHMPSILDSRSLTTLKNAPLEFLRGCGLSDILIEYLPSLIEDPIQFYSCFISYSSNDHGFVGRLHADLQDNGVRCWFAPEDLKIGDKIRTTIDESIRLFDKLLLVLSEHSVRSQWVEKEVETGMERERQQNRLILFPIRLDDAVMEIGSGWAADVKRTRHIGDFRDWQINASYNKAFDRLMRDLNAGGMYKPKKSNPD